MNIPLKTSFALLFLSLSVLSPQAKADKDAPQAPHFELGRWASEEKIKLSDFAGQIVVLDFFAYWCLPCKTASKEMEAGVQKYYEEKHGNPHGVQIKVLSVNIEQDMPKQTTAYIKQTGISTVINDFGGKLLGQLKGPGTPFIVVIDGTRATAGKPDFRILLRQAGFEGTQPIRKVIDSVKPDKSAAAANLKSVRPVAGAPTGAPVVHKAEAGFEGMIASDLTITTTALSYGQQHGGTEWSAGYTHNTFAEHYEPYAPFDFIGYPQRIHEDSESGRVSLRQRLGGGLTFLASAGVYNGFTDFRSLWFATYYKQQFNVEEAYRKPDPHGYSGSAGLRWEYLPSAGFVEAGFFYSNDRIAPGYERDADTEETFAGRDHLQTYAPSLRFENILTPRVRVLHEVQLTLTTGRDPRYAYRGSLNVALGERWVWRTSGGYTREDPSLRAWFAGTTLEYQLAERWLVNVSGLYYHDTGEIENSLFISTAAPGLVSYQSGVGLKYAGEKSSFALSLAPVFSEYQALQVGTRPFSNLYRDRTWIQVQASWALEF